MNTPQQSTCPQCQKIMPAKALNAHLRKHSKATFEGVSPSAEGVWTCPQSGCTYTTSTGREAFKKHWQRMHKSVSSPATAPLSALTPGQSTSMETPVASTAPPSRQVLPHLIAPREPPSSPSPHPTAQILGGTSALVPLTMQPSQEAQEATEAEGSLAVPDAEATVVPCRMSTQLFLSYCHCCSCFLLHRSTWHHCQP